MQQHPGTRSFVLPKLYNRKGSLTKRWYIEFQAWNTETKELEKKRVTCPAKFLTKKQRETWGRDTSISIAKLLENGYCFGNAAPPIQKVENSSELVLTKDLENTLEKIRATLRAKTTITYYSALNKLKSFLVWTSEAAEELYIKKLSEATTLTQFLATDSITFRDYLITELRNSPRTANNTIEHLNTIYKHLKLRTDIPDSPFKVKKLKEEVTTKNIAFSDVDRSKIEKYLIEHEPELYLFTRIMYFAFIRPGELNHITLADVRLEDGYISGSRNDQQEWEN